MPEEKRWLLVCVVIGAILVLVYSTASALAVHVKDHNGASSNTLFAASHMTGTVVLPPYVKEKAEIAALERPLRPASPDLDVHVSNRDYGLDDMSAEDLQLPPELNCSTDVILAVFFKSRQCKTGTLVVVAASELAGEANLELIDYGPMKWDGKSQMWFIKIRDLETNPEIVMVAGDECQSEAPVLTMPFACDAKLPLGLENDS